MFETDYQEYDFARSWMIVLSDCRQRPANEETGPATGLLG